MCRTQRVDPHRVGPSCASPHSGPPVGARGIDAHRSIRVNESVGCVLPEPVRAGPRLLVTAEPPLRALPLAGFDVAGLQVTVAMLVERAGAGTKARALLGLRLTTRGVELGAGFVQLLNCSWTTRCRRGAPVESIRSARVGATRLALAVATLPEEIRTADGSPTRPAPRTSTLEP